MDRMRPACWTRLYRCFGASAAGLGSRGEEGDFAGIAAGLLASCWPEELRVADIKPLWWRRGSP